MALMVSQTFDDTEELSRALRHTNVSAMQLSRGRFEGTLSRFTIDDWCFQHIAFHDGIVTCSGDSPATAGCVLVPLRSHPQSSLLGKPVRDATIAVYGRKSEHADVSHPGVRHMVITLPDNAVRLPRSGSQIVQADPESARMLRVLLEKLQTAAENCSSNFAQMTTKRAISDELTTALKATITLPEHRSRVGRPELPRGAIIGRIKEYLDANSGEAVFIGELCKAAGVSVPTLRRVFVDRYGTPPAHYLLLRRYYIARMKLRSGEAKSVRDVAESCGFWELSRFSAGYRTLFGELPSQAIVKKNDGEH